MKQKQLNAVNILKIQCQDGPFKGAYLRLSIDGKTLPFTVKGKTGYYIQGVYRVVS
jgi:hypothetical protein